MTVVWFNNLGTGLEGIDDYLFNFKVHSEATPQQACWEQSGGLEQIKILFAITGSFKIEARPGH